MYKCRGSKPINQSFVILAFCKIRSQITTTKYELNQGTGSIKNYI